MLEYFLDTWSILHLHFDIFYGFFGTIRGNLVYFPVLVFCTKKNLATLDVCRTNECQSFAQRIIKEGCHASSHCYCDAKAAKENFDLQKRNPGAYPTKSYNYLVCNYKYM
jgi:hypothetical protein